MTVSGLIVAAHHPTLLLTSLLAITVPACTTPASHNFIGHLDQPANVGDTKLAATAGTVALTLTV